MQCSYFDAGVCRSCTRMGVEYHRQLAEKEQGVRGLLSAWPGLEWLPSFASAESGFRNKAKLVVGGTVDSPTVGIVDDDGVGVDLQHCGLYEAALAVSFPVLAEFITRAQLVPFDIPSGRGELKNILVTVSPAGELMIRFVLRSQEARSRIEKHLRWLRERLPQAAVITINLLPERKAVPEGDIDIVLTETEALPMRLTSGLTLYLRPQSFFQTNTSVATALYTQAREWVDAVACPAAPAAGPSRILDLYCGVGGVALHCAAPGREVQGVEVSEQAIASATLSAAEAQINAQFRVGDATAATAAADLVIVNPPRRGIGPLAAALNGSPATHIIYSSCNAVTLAKDLAAMPAFVPVTARVFDMFPQTTHAETMVLLRRV